MERQGWSRKSQGSSGARGTFACVYAWLPHANAESQLERCLNGLRTIWVCPHWHARRTNEPISTSQRKFRKAFGTMHGHVPLPCWCAERLVWWGSALETAGTFEFRQRNALNKVRERSSDSRWESYESYENECATLRNIVLSYWMYYPLIPVGSSLGDGATYVAPKGIHFNNTKVKSVKSVSHATRFHGALVFFHF